MKIRFIRRLSTKASGTNSFRGLVLMPSLVGKNRRLPSSSNGSPKGLLATASSMVAQYLESTDLKNLHVVGFDAHADNLKYLRSGTIDFLIDQDPFEQGNLGLKVLFDYLLLKKKPKKIYSSPRNIVTRENARYFRKLSEGKLEEHAMVVGLELPF